MFRRKLSRYITGVFLIALSAAILAAAMFLYYILPGGLTLLAPKYNAYVTANLVTVSAPFISYTVWFVAYLLYQKRNRIPDYRHGRQMQPVCIMAAALLTFFLELFFALQIHFPTALNNVVCIGLSTVIYTAAAALACFIGHPF